MVENNMSSKPSKKIDTKTSQMAGFLFVKAGSKCVTASNGKNQAKSMVCPKCWHEKKNDDLSKIW
jgi:hypothetical protein